MTQPASAPALASVVFIKVKEFTRRPVAEQARLRVQLEAVIAVAIAPLRAEERVVLDSPDGIAVVVLANPKGALETAERSLAASSGLPLCIGVNHGPVTAAGGGQDAQALAGDGIHSAAIVAGFAEPTRVLVSRSFREALGEFSPDQEATLRSAGIFTDSTVRTHELLTPDQGAGKGRRQRFLGMGAAGVIALLLMGLLLRTVVQDETISGPPAILVLRISPSGEVFVDGDSKGHSPPLTQIKVRPGSHTIEVQNSSYPPLKLEVDLKPGEQATIRHTFGGKKTPAELMRKLGKKLGLE